MFERCKYILIKDNINHLESEKGEYRLKVVFLETGH